MLGGSEEEGSIFLTPIFFHPTCSAWIIQILFWPQTLIFIASVINHLLGAWQWPNLWNGPIDSGIKISAYLSDVDALQSWSGCWWLSKCQERTDYCSLQQMPVPVNNVKGKQQLNDQTHYSSLQIKATRDSDAVFVRAPICRGREHVPARYCIEMCVGLRSVCARDAAWSSFSFPQP